MVEVKEPHDLGHSLRGVRREIPGVALGCTISAMSCAAPWGQPEVLRGTGGVPIQSWVVAASL